MDENISEAIQDRRGRDGQSLSQPGIASGHRKSDGNDLHMVDFHGFSMFFLSLLEGADIFGNC